MSTPEARANPVTTTADGPLPEIIPAHETPTGSWSYLLADAATGQAAVIDPVWGYDPVSGCTDARFIDELLGEAAARHWQIAWVLETHVHADHLSAASYIRDRCGARIAIGEGIRAVQETFKRVYHLPDFRANGSEFDRLLADGDTLPLGTLTIRVMHTPGHTGDSVTYCVADAAFIGDTLFEPEYGTARCDFPGGDAAAMFDSIQRIHALPDATRLFLCHDYPPEGKEPVCMVTVAQSRSGNVHANAGIRRADFVRLRQARDATLGLPRLILPALQVNMRAGAPPPAESNGVAYLRIPFNQSLRRLVERRN